jgi:hypothetical protein
MDPGAVHNLAKRKISAFARKLSLVVHLGFHAGGCFAE